MDKKSYYSILVVIGLLFVFWGVHSKGWFWFPELLLYDVYVRAAPEQKLASQKILLIEVSPTDIFSDGSKWSMLNKRLQTLGAAQIVYTFVPENVSRDFFLDAQSMGNICFGRWLTPDRGAKESSRLAPLPPQTAGLDLISGVFAVPSPDYGIYRFYRSFVSVGGERLPTLVYAAANQRLGRSLAVSERFLVNFNGKTQSLGRISLETALSDQLVTEVVGGKSILIGLSGVFSLPGLQTPINLGASGLSMLEYQGLALDTLISDKKIYHTGPWINLICLFGVFIVGLIAYQIMRFLQAFWFTAIILTGYMTVCWFFFSFLLIWPPIFAIITTQCLILVIVLRRRQQRDLDVLKTVLTRLTDRLKAYIIPENFINTSQHWYHILTMVSQTLNLGRSIFLETVENDHRVREIAADNCTFSAIRERRRDFERTPYTTALAENGPIRVNGFLAPDVESELQFLVPLLFADQILGFWSFGIDQNEYAAFNNFEDMVNNYGQQIAEMLYQRQRWQEQKSRQHNTVVQLMKLQAGKTVSRKIFETYAFVEKKLFLFESVLSRLKTAVIVYDLFGNVMQINTEMEHLLLELDLKPFDLTAAELAGNLCRIDIAEARRRLNQVVTTRESIIMPVITTSAAERGYILVIHSIWTDRDSTADAETVEPFQILGVLFELFEITEFKETHTLKDDLLRALNRQQEQNFNNMSNHLARLEETCRFDKNEMKEALPALKSALYAGIEIEKKVNNYLSQNLFTDMPPGFPVSYTKHLNQAVRDLRHFGQNRKIKFNIQAIENADAVLASPHLLYRLFHTLLSILMEDAVEETIIEITCEPKEDFVEIGFRNYGFGMPDESLKHYILSGQARASKSFGFIRNMIPQVRQWGGDLSASSAVGQGLVFTLKLKKMD